MRQNFNDRLRRGFPELYTDDMPDYMLDVPPGWEQLVLDLSEQLRGENVRCEQIKEKYGGLRCYFDGDLSEDGVAALDVAVSRSLRTCDWCGAFGVMRSKGDWYMVRCTEHADRAVPVVRLTEMKSRGYGRS